MKSFALQSLSLSGLVAVAAAAPTTTHTETVDPCHVTSYSAVAAAVASCTNITLDSIAVPGNTTLDLTKLKAGAVVTFAGTTTFAYADANYDMIKVAGTDVTITAQKGAIIDGNGQAWWDGLGSNGGVAKPNHFITISKAIGKSVVKSLVIQNYPVHCFSISGSNGLVVENIFLNNTAGEAPNSRSNGLAAAHNTDGFDISSTDGMILRDSRVLNQDDCVAITSGNNITVSNMYCDGGHGLSIGSVGGKVSDSSLIKTHRLTSRRATTMSQISYSKTVKYSTARTVQESSPTPTLLATLPTSSTATSRSRTSTSTVSTFSKTTSMEGRPEAPQMVSSSRTSLCPTSLALLRPRLETTISSVEMVVAQTLPSTTSILLEEPTALATSSLLETSSVFEADTEQNVIVDSRANTCLHALPEYLFECHLESKRVCRKISSLVFCAPCCLWASDHWRPMVSPSEL